MMVFSIASNGNLSSFRCESRIWKLKAMPTRRMNKLVEIFWRAKMTFADNDVDPDSEEDSQPSFGGTG